MRKNILRSLGSGVFTDPSDLFLAGDTGDWWNFNDRSKTWTGENLTGSNNQSSGVAVKSAEGQVNATVLNGSVNSVEQYYDSSANGSYGLVRDTYYAARTDCWSTSAFLPLGHNYTIIDVCVGGDNGSPSETLMASVTDDSTTYLEHRVKESRNRVQCRADDDGGNTGTIDGSSSSETVRNRRMVVITEIDFDNDTMKQYVTNSVDDVVEVSSTAITSTWDADSAMKFRHGFGYGDTGAVPADSWCTFDTIVIDRILTADEKQSVSDWGATKISI